LRARLLGCLCLALAVSSPAGPAQEPSEEAWRSFAGTWSASGRREAVPVEGGTAATIVEVSGAVVLTRGDGLSRGFRGQAIGFDDGQGQSLGRCVWTDENGDRLFSRLSGGSLGTGRRFVGTITGGTGRYAHAVGEYSFTWQYVVAAPEGDEAGTIQGRAVQLEGRVRRALGSR
jgi:hypothetical protein